jgi:hypothetical protein
VAVQTLFDYSGHDIGYPSLQPLQSLGDITNMFLNSMTTFQTLRNEYLDYVKHTKGISASLPVVSTKHEDTAIFAQ